MTRRRIVDRLMTFMLWGAAALLVFLLLAIILYIFINGYEVLSWSFLTEPPRDNMTRGGISTLMGTLQLVVVSMLSPFP